MTSPAVSLEELARLLRELRSDVAALRAEGSEVLDVPAVRARYRLRDPRTARAIMRQAGAFMVARRLLVHRAALEAWELERARAAPKASSRATSSGKRDSPR